MGGKTFNISFIQYLSNLTMLNGFFGIDHIDGVYWTLLLELRFYFIIGFILCFRKLKTNYLIIFVIGWLIISYLQLIINFDSHVVLKFLREFLIINYSSYFISGILLYKIYIEKNLFKFTPLLILSYILSVILSIDEVESLSKVVNVSFNKVVITLYITLFYCLMYLVSIHRLNFLNRSLFLRIGLLTYPLYLIHQNVGFIIFNQFGSIINKYLLLFIIVSFALLVSYLINQYIERPLGKKMLLIFKKLDL